MHPKLSVWSMYTKLVGLCVAMCERDEEHSAFICFSLLLCEILCDTHVTRTAIKNYIHI